VSIRCILASASPQRKWLLEGIGLDFEVIPSTVDEAICTETDPVERAKALARLKAEDVAAKHPDAYVLGADTLVVASDGTLLEKPIDADDARKMLKMHSGKTSTVYSTICLILLNGELSEAISASKVTFKELSDEEIAWWIATNEWKDRSGAFQIDGKGQLIIERIEGDWTGVVGLPVCILGQLLQDNGIAF
jgi:septum formation protein